MYIQPPFTFPDRKEFPLYLKSSKKSSTGIYRNNKYDNKALW